MRQIIFEKLESGKWNRTEDDPDDNEYEFVDIISNEVVYNQIEKFKKRGWKVKQNVDPSFNGLILIKETKK